MIFEELDIKLNGLFKQITDKNNFLPIFGSEYSFAVVYALKEYEKLLACVNGDCIIIKGEKAGKTIFAPPICPDKETFARACGQIYDYCRDSGEEFNILCVTKEMCSAVSNNPLYSITEDRDMFEYLYSVEEQINLVGRKYHSKRTFIHGFRESYEYSIKEYTDSDLASVTELIDKWEERKYHYSAYEKAAILKTLKYRRELDVVCNVMRADGVTAGLIIASVDRNKDVNLIFEKADVTYKGIYQAMLNEFLKTNFSGYRYLNLQEDMGIEGLRKAKLSYNPFMLLEKYNISANNR